MEYFNDLADFLHLPHLHLQTLGAFSRSNNHLTLMEKTEDGNVINQTPGKNKKIVPIKENTTSSSGGEYNGPIELGLKKWRKSELFPFSIDVNNYHNKKSKGKHLKNNINKVVGMWEKGIDRSYDIDTHDVHTVKEWVEITKDTNVDYIVESMYKKPLLNSGGV